MNRILPIVEGDGDLKAVPLLLRNLLSFHGLHETQILSPHKRGELPKVAARFEDYFRMALKENAAILLVLDFDCEYCDCPLLEAEKLYQRALAIRNNWPFKIAFLIEGIRESFFGGGTSRHKCSRSSSSHRVSRHTRNDARCQGLVEQGAAKGFQLQTHSSPSKNYRPPQFR